MPEPFVRFQVVCPECRNEEPAALPIAVVADALVTGKAVRLHVSCHDVYWTATPEEMERLRVELASMPSHAEKSFGSKPATLQNPGICRAKPKSQLTVPR